MIPLMIFADSHWDAYTIATTKWQEWFRDRAEYIVGWSPWQDKAIQWFGNKVGCYVDTYAIYNNTPPDPNDIAVLHPEWIACDPNGNKLYIPYNCANGTCPQFAGDITHPRFLKNQLTGIQSIIKTGYNAIYLDDVNLEPRISDGNGNVVMPYEMTPDMWARFFSIFVSQIKSFISSVSPSTKIFHNSIWFSSAPQESIDTQIKACDFVNCERGFGDPNLNPTTFQQFMSFIDHVHSLNRNVVQEELSKDNLSFKIACFLLMYELGDLMVVGNLFPDAWDSQMDVKCGKPLAPRYSITNPDGTISWARNFDRVRVNVNFSNKTGSVVSV